MNQLGQGSRLGPYEISAQIGAGGMGEVYRAKDPRLGREVAIKVLPASFSEDADRLRRFEQEARAAGILNHPNITAVYDVGQHDGAPYVVQELLEGETLRAALGGARLSPRKAIDYALQIAHGLAEAHEKGIVHRDLKPENLFVTKDGRVKILDFGLAKLTHQEEDGRATNLPTAPAGTEPGVVMGTLGYMSPEQVKGKPSDARSDIFSFGAILYEMLSGKRAFHGDSAAETMSAILREEPPDISVTNQNISSGLERIVRHCIEKSPERRFHSAHDVAFDLEALSGASGASVAPPTASFARAKSRFGPYLAGAAILVIGAALGFVARSRQGAPPSFKRLTFRRGTVWTARFAPDGQTVVYGAAWEENPIEAFLTRPESPESRHLGLKNASLFGVSPTGELAVMLDAKTTASSYSRFGTLARVPLAGGSPRAVLENVHYADWSPDGKDLMVERDVAGKHRIELPIGKLLYETTHRINTPRVSPKGNAVAFFESVTNGVEVRVVDLAGKARTLATANDWWNLGWSPDGTEIWFAAPEPEAGGTSSLQAVSLSGRRRLLLRLPGTLEFHDVARDGRVLFSRLNFRGQIVGLAPGEKKERDLSWLDIPDLVGLSADGRAILINETGEGGGPNGSIYVRATDGSPATLIGEGIALALSPDGQWVLSRAPTKPPTLVLLPTGPGAPRTLELEGLTDGTDGVFFPDGKRLLLVDTAPGQLSRSYVASIEGGKPRPLGPPGMALTGPVTRTLGTPVSPDGRFVFMCDKEKRIFLCPVDGGAPVPVAGLSEGEFPIQWSPDGRFLFIRRVGEIHARIWRLEIATGKKELVREVAPSDSAGVTTIESLLVTPDGRSLAYSYVHNLSDLYVVEGLK
jgi:Tol biopolymer transport system component